MLRTLLCSLLLIGSGAALADAPDPELREVLKAAANESPSFVDRFEAEVWLTDMSGRLERQVRDPEERIELLKLVHMEAARVELPPELILARDIATSSVVTTRPNETLTEVMRKLSSRGLEEIPVLDLQDERKVHFMLTRRAVLARYATELERQKGIYSDS